MIRRKVTRKDVALSAGVSETIVSYVLNDNRYVDSIKRERVLKAVKDLGYVPNPVARALKGKEAHHILFIVDDLESDYFGSIIGEMEKLVEGQGYLFSLASDRGDKNFVSTVGLWRFDGIIIGSATISPDDIQRIIDTGMPTVILSMKDYPRFLGRYALLFTGLLDGSIALIDHLKKRGREKIAFVDSFSAERNGVDKSGFRYKGYMEAIGGRKEILIERFKDSEELRKALAEAYEEHHFDALFCRTDRIAAESLIALNAMGLRVPDDVSVAGVNNSRISLYTRPRLTSLAIRKDEVARKTLELLRELKKEEEGILSATLKTDIIERESV